MTRWHLIDQAGEPALALRAAAAEREPTLVVGDRRLGALAEAAGVGRGEYLSAPLGRTGMAGPAIRRTLRRVGASACVAWSDSAARVARRFTRINTETRSASEATPAWRVHDEPDREQRRAERRDAWGVDDNTACVLAVGGDAVSGDAYDAAMAVGLAREARLATGKGELRLVVRPSQSGRVHAWSLWRDFGLGRLLIAEPRAAEPWAILPAVDAVLDLGPEPTPWRRWIDDLGLPRVGPVSLPSRYGPVVDVRRAAGGLADALTQLSR